MKLMGHADLNSTSRYVHLSKRHLADAQKKIEQYRAAREIAEAEAAQRVSGTLQGDCGEKRGDSGTFRRRCRELGMAAYR
jgi:hypothetical protein